MQKADNENKEEELQLKRDAQTEDNTNTISIFWAY